MRYKPSSYPETQLRWRADPAALQTIRGGCWRWRWWCVRHADWKRCRRLVGWLSLQPRVGSLPTSYATNYPPETKPYGGGKEPPSALQYLPEKFRRMHIRNTHLQWGGEKQYESTAKKELCHPRVQEPLGGKPTETDVNVMYDFRRSGYENNVTQASPITPRRKLIDTCNITSRPMRGASRERACWMDVVCVGGVHGGGEGGGAVAAVGGDRDEQWMLDAGG